MPDSQVVERLQDFKRRLAAMEVVQQREMARRWLNVEQALEGHMQALAQQIAERQATGTVTRNMLYRMERYKVLMAQTQTQLRGYADYAGDLITRQQRTYTEMGISDAYEALRMQTGEAGIQATFGRMPVSAVENMIGRASDGSPLRALLAKSLTQDTVEAVTQSIVDNIALGKNPRELARRMVRDGYDKGLNRALVLARDQQMRAYRSAADAQYRESGVGVYKVRLAAKDDRVCLACLAADGERIELDDEMYDHPQGRCLAPGTPVSGPLPIGFVSRHYDGDVVSIRTASGKFLTVTPNHPILTDRGWIAAEFIQEGDNVVSDGRSEWAAPDMGPDKYQMPTLIENVPSALGMVQLGSVPCSAEDFHGDGKGSDVYVVWADGNLRNHRFSKTDTIPQPFAQQYFSGRGIADIGLTGCGDFAAMLKSLLAPPTGFLGNANTPMMLLNGRLDGKQAISDSVSASLYTCLVESCLDYLSGYSKRLRDGILGFSGKIPSSDLPGWDDGIGIAPQPASLEFIRQALLSTVETFGDRNRVFAAHVCLDRVLEVGRTHFSGHVYNLQTQAGWYSANGIITHNCTAVVIVEGLEPPEFQRGPEWFAEQSEATQRAMMGDKRYEAWKDGKFEFSQLASVTHHETWGEGLKVTSLGDLLDGGGGGLPVEIGPGPMPELPIPEPNPWELSLQSVASEKDAIQLQGGSDKVESYWNQFGYNAEAKTRTMHDLADRLTRDPDWNAALETFHRNSLDVSNYGSMPSEKVVSNLIDRWAKTSGDSDNLAVALQMAAKQEFGLDDAFMFSKELQDDAIGWWGDAMPGLRSFLREQYRLTQETLEKQGVDRVLAWRGMASRKDVGYISEAVDAELRPMSSFSTDYGVAEGFASGPLAGTGAHPQKWMLMAEIPKERIIGMPGTGFGCLSEKEIVVLSGPGKVRLTTFAKADELPTSALKFFYHLERQKKW